MCIHTKVVKQYTKSRKEVLKMLYGIIMVLLIVFGISGSSLGADGAAMGLICLGLAGYMLYLAIREGGGTTSDGYKKAPGIGTKSRDEYNRMHSKLNEGMGWAKHKWEKEKHSTPWEESDEYKWRKKRLEDFYQQHGKGCP